MSIMVKNAMGGESEVASKGVTTAALTTGIIGTALGVLGGTNLLGTNDGNGNGGLLNSNGNGCKVSQEKYYEDRIADIRANNAQNMAFQLQLCDIQARVASNEVANGYQNRIVDIGFANVDTRFATENIINDKNLQLSLCGTIKGQTYLNPNQLADNYIAPSRVLDSYTPREYTPARGFYGGQASMAYGGYAPGWDGCSPCNGYQGF